MSLTKPQPEPVSAAVQDYCKTIHMLAGSDSDLVATSRVATRLGVSAGSASAMISNLAALGLARHTPYRGTRLTESGERIAIDTIRNHRLLELFLHEVVGMPWDEVHSEAEVLEHAISNRLQQLIADKLGDPKFDPHGDPIPGWDGTIASVAAEPLVSLELGSTGRIARISDSDSAVLRHLTALKIACGDSVEVRSRDPFGGPIHIRVNGRRPDIAIAPGVARAIEIAPIQTQIGSR